MIFTRDFVTRENYWQIASLVTQKSLFMVTHALFLISLWWRKYLFHLSSTDWFTNMLQGYWVTLFTMLVSIWCSTSGSLKTANPYHAELISAHTRLYFLTLGWCRWLKSFLVEGSHTFIMHSQLTSVAIVPTPFDRNISYCFSTRRDELKFVDSSDT